jgi:hypothetical protein
MVASGGIKYAAFAPSEAPLRRVEPLLNSEHERGGPPPEGQTGRKETPP